MLDWTDSSPGEVDACGSVPLCGALEDMTSSEDDEPASCREVVEIELNGRLLVISADVLEVAEGGDTAGDDEIGSEELALLI